MGERGGGGCAASLRDFRQSPNVKERGKFGNRGEIK